MGLWPTRGNENQRRRAHAGARHGVPLQWPGKPQACPNYALADGLWRAAPPPAVRKGSEGVKKSKQLTPRRKGAKKRQGEAPAFLCELCVLCGFA
jgi:hypothetical protein